MTYLKTSLDANHKAIAQHLRRVGCEVLELLKPLDLLVTKHGNVSFIEIKIPGSAAKWTRTQLQWISSTKFNVIVAKTGEEAFSAIRDRRYLSQSVKDGIAALLCTEPRDYYTPSVVDKIISNGAK